MRDNSFNRIRINLGGLESNYRYIHRRAGLTVPAMAMVKADGYGHGMVKAAQAFARGGCGLFGVAELREGVILRQAGISGDIYVTIGFDTQEVEAIFQHQLTPVIYSYEAARALSTQALALGRDIGVHVKVDTGMSRLGIFPDELPGFLASASGLGGIKISGIMSHFPESDDPNSVSTKSCLRAFTQACRELKGKFPGLCHIANSGAVLNFPEARFDMVRAGIALYGYHPGGSAAAAENCAGALTPAMSFHSRILQVKTLPAGTGISYGHTFKTRRVTRIGVIPVGYEDGYSRALSNKGRVLVRGRQAPVRGRICMNMCMVDVTDIEDVAAGDEVVLLGRQETEMISADDIAEMIESISYEVLCMLGNNNQREYIG
ncbi:MAG: alanine racemase [Desulforhopalus sp.]